MADGKTVVAFTFPHEPDALENLADRMRRIQKYLKGIPKVKAFAITGKTAKKITDILEPDQKEVDSGLVLHAMRELEHAGNDQDFNNSMIAAVEAFSSYGHSGGSASVAIPMLNDLLQFKNLTPLTDDPSEWMKVEMGDEDCWQCVRNPEAFSNDNGKTYYLLSDGSNSEKQAKLYETSHKEELKSDGS